MTFMLALDELTDAELVDRIATGDPMSAARFWVRHWPTALSAARGLVEPAEVPGLAAEALIGTIATIRVGTGPQDHAAVFVIDAVHELGGDEYSGRNLSGVQYPDVFPSAVLGSALGELRVEDQQLLWAALADNVAETDLAAQLGVSPAHAHAMVQASLGALQTAFVRRHAAMAVQPDCAATHSFLDSAIEHPATSFPHSTWMHLSECVICTEAFHELAHTPVTLGPLLGAAAYPGPLAASEPEAVVEPGKTLEPPEPLEPLVALEPAAEPEPDPPALAEPLVLAAAQDEAPAADPLPVPALADPEASHDAEAFSFFAHDDTISAAPPVRMPEEDEEREERNRRRPVLLVAAAAAVAAAIALGISLSGGGDEPTRPSAQTLTGSTPTATPTGTPTPVTVVDPPAAHTPRAKPRTTATPNPSSTPTSSATRKPTSKPTRTTSHANPGPTSSPAPPSSPTPTPTPSPTPTCRGLQKLLNLC